MTMGSLQDGIASRSEYPRAKSLIMLGTGTSGPLFIMTSLSL
jgi:hypothetical protein